MGQQQLLLLVLGIVIVTIAILEALTTIPEKMKQSQADNLVNRHLELASAAVARKSLRDPYNGGNTEYTGLDDDGFTKLFMESTTHRGTFGLNVPSAFKLEIMGESIRYSAIGVRTSVTNYDVASTVVRFDGSITIE